MVFKVVIYDFYGLRKCKKTTPNLRIYWERDFVECIEIEQKLYEFLKSNSKDDIKLKLNENKKMLMLANKSKNTVEINFKNAIKIYEECKVGSVYSCSISDYFQLALCHEIGHLEDIEYQYDDLEVKKSEITIKEKINNTTDENEKIEIAVKVISDSVKKEYEAEKIGKKYVPESLTNDYFALNFLNKIEYFAYFLLFVKEFQLAHLINIILDKASKEYFEFYTKHEDTIKMRAEKIKEEDSRFPS